LFRGHFVTCNKMSPETFCYRDVLLRRRFVWRRFVRRRFVQYVRRFFSCFRVDSHRCGTWGWSDQSECLSNRVNAHWRIEMTKILLTMRYKRSFAYSNIFPHSVQFNIINFIHYSCLPTFRCAAVAFLCLQCSGIPVFTVQWHFCVKSVMAFMCSQSSVIPVFTVQRHFCVQSAVCCWY
jgi:hypothetical protein